MKDQHEKIKTYRDLSQEEIDLINEVKELEARVNGFIDKLSTRHIDLENRRCKKGVEPLDIGRIDIAQTNIETGFMYLIKSIAKPERLSKQG